MAVTAAVAAVLGATDRKVIEDLIMEDVSQHDSKDISIHPCHRTQLPLCSRMGQQLQNLDQMSGRVAQKCALVPNFLPHI